MNNIIHHHYRRHSHGRRRRPHLTHHQRQHQNLYHHHQWRKPGAEFEGTEKFFADQDEVFSEKFPFWRQKFLMTFFSNRPDFSNFPSLFPDFPELYFVSYRTQPFPHKKNTFFYFFHTFAHIRQHYFSKYWGTNAWAVPSLKLWGPSPPVSPRFPPLIITIVGIVKIVDGVVLITAANFAASILNIIVGQIFRIDHHH